MSGPKETTAERFTDGGAIDLIRDAVSGELQLLAFDGKGYQVGQQVEYAGRQFILPDVSPSASRAITLPSGCSTHGSTNSLFTSMYKVFADNGIPAGAARATYFSLASWFPDVLPMAPCLLITGPAPEANLLLDLLGCLTRRALPLIGTNGAALSSLPLDLQPTLLINGACASRSSLKLLAASGRGASCVCRKDGILTNFYFAKAVHLGNEGNDLFSADTALLVNLLPTRGKLPILTEQARVEIKSTFQPKLLSYRLRHFREVEASDFDLPQFGSGIRILARTFGAPIVGALELQGGLGPVFHEQQEKLADQRWRDPRRAAIEAALAFCHDGVKRVYVGELAQKATAILAGRGETTMLEARTMGNVLRESLGIFPQRSSEGYGLDLTETIVRKIHLLARDFEVAAMLEGMPSCTDCRDVLARPAEE